MTWNALIAKNMGMKLSHETARSMLGVLKGSLKTLEAAWLKAEGGAFMMGAEDPCIADLLVAEVGVRVHSSSLCLLLRCTSHH